MNFAVLQHWDLSLTVKIHLMALPYKTLQHI